MMRIKILICALSLGALSMTGSCRVPPPGSVSGRAVSCTTEAVRTQWPRVVGPVNDCLTRPDGADWRGCLGAVGTAAGVAIDVIACVVRHQGESYAQAVTANPADQRSGRAAVRAQEYQAGITYAEER